MNRRLARPPPPIFENLSFRAEWERAQLISDLGRFLVEQSNDWIDPVLPRLSKGEETALTGGAAVIKNGKFVGWLSNFETRGLNILRNTEISSNYEVDCPLHPTETIVVGAGDFNARYRLREVNGQTTLQLKVRGEFETLEFSGGHGPLAEIQDDLEKKVSVEVQNELEQTIRRAQELGADILGVGRYLEALNPICGEE